MNYSFKKKYTLFYSVLLSSLALHEYSYSNSLVVDHNNLMNMTLDTTQKLALLFPKTIDEINQRTDAAIALVDQEIADILKIEHPTFENTVRALDLSLNKFKKLKDIFELLSNVHPENDIREAINQAFDKLRQYSFDILMNVGLYERIQNYNDNERKNETLSNSDVLLLDNYLKKFKKFGLHLSAEILNQVKALAKEIASLEQKFQVNMNEDNSSIKATKDELNGVSESFINRLSKDGDVYTINCDMASYVAVMTECKVEKTRKNLFLTKFNSAYPQNDTVLIELLKKRQELATLLGHKNFATLDLAQTSAQNIETVDNFLQKLVKAAHPKTVKEFAELKKDLPEGIEIQADGSFKEWDLPYVFNQYKKKYFSIDETKISEYFPVQKVIDGIFKIYQNFLDLNFKQVTPAWSWHEDVMLIEIHRQSSQEFLGYIFLDLYPRANKFPHACEQSISLSFEDSGKNIPCAIGLIANFPKPSADTPALLKYNDVITFFHELGHAMHDLLGRTKHPGQAGTNTALDFIETPSQMFEEWMYEPEMLNLVSGHYQTGETLPKEIIEKKITLRQANSGYWTLRQATYALFSLYLMANKDESYNPTLLWKMLHQKHYHGLLNYEEQDHGHAIFLHLASDLYASKYYTYLWTKVFALDLFSEIKNNNFNDEYSKKVINLLSVGGSIDSEINLEQFLGRKPNQEAFLKILGLE